MNVRWLLVVVVLSGCSGSRASASLTMQANGFDPAMVAAISVIVFGGPTAGCERVLAPVDPLDDTGLEVEAHALFTIGAADGSEEAPHLEVPTAEELAFYAEAYATTAPGRDRLGRGCSEMVIAAGSGTTAIAVSIDAGP